MSDEQTASKDEPSMETKKGYAATGPSSGDMLEQMWLEIVRGVKFLTTVGLIVMVIWIAISEHRTAVLMSASLSSLLQIQDNTAAH